MDSSLPPVGAAPKEVLMVLKGFWFSFVIDCFLGCLVLYPLLDRALPREVFVIGTQSTNSFHQSQMALSKSGHLQVTMKMAWGGDDDQSQGRVSAKVG